MASQERCERLKRSFGGWRTIMLYLEPPEQVRLQGLDHYTYETGVPRAQTNMPLRRVYYFLADRYGVQIDSLEVPSNRVRNYMYTTWLVTKSKDSDELLKAPRKAPPVEHEGFALTAFGDSHLVYTGGVDDRRAGMTTTLFYNFEADEWKQGPDLNEARSQHSSCSLGDFTYVIAGEDKWGKNTNSIARLNAKESILETACSSLTHQWEGVQVSGATLKVCTQPLVCQLNDKELLILGGHFANESRALALHHESLELRLLSDRLPMDVIAKMNQGVKLANNKVAACFTDIQDEHTYVVTYTPEEPHKIQIVKDLGGDYF